jgi:nitrite reductase/ring-hydroxylating ferredoxin subunit
MVVGLLVLLVSLGLRTGAPLDRTGPTVLSLVGFLILVAGAYVGGDVVFALGNMVNRHAWRGRGTKWVPLALDGAAEIAEGVPVKAAAGPNTLVLVRVGPTIHALHEQCAHAGGPLSQGRVVDGCIECPWHRSRFRLRDGTAAAGPTLYDQPAYEVRAAEGGGYEVRRTT